MGMGTRSETRGILPARAIARYCEEGLIRLVRPADADQIQPASLDLRLGDWAYRVRASFLPGPRSTVEARVKELALHRMPLTDGAVLETGCVYIVPLQESLKLPKGVAAAANPKSSTGRLDIFTRVITDYAQEFDKVPEGYEGPLFAEISPRTFPILVREGSRLSQIRFRQGATLATDTLIRELHDKEGLISSGEVNIDNGLALSVDLSTLSADGPVGFRAKRHAGLIDVDRKAALDVNDFWEPIWQRGSLVLDPDQFYILASKEAVHVPPTHAAEMVPFNPRTPRTRIQARQSSAIPPLVL